MPHSGLCKRKSLSELKYPIYDIFSRDEIYMNSYHGDDWALYEIDYELRIEMDVKSGASDSQFESGRRTTVSVSSVAGFVLGRFLVCFTTNS